MLVPCAGQTNPLGTAGSVPVLLSPPPRQLLCLSLLGALPSPPSTGGFRAPSAPQTPTRFLRAWEARAAPAQLPGREELPADVWSSALGRVGGKQDLHVPLEQLPQSWMSLVRAGMSLGTCGRCWSQFCGGSKLWLSLSLALRAGSRASLRIPWHLMP